jgi:hypothetical protein
VIRYFFPRDADGWSMTTDQDMRPGEAALLLGCSTAQLRKLAEKRFLRPTLTFGGHARYLREEVQAIIDGGGVEQILGVGGGGSRWPGIGGSRWPGAGGNHGGDLKWE